MYQKLNGSSKKMCTEPFCISDLSTNSVFQHKLSTLFTLNEVNYNSLQQRFLQLQPS